METTIDSVIIEIESNAKKSNESLNALLTTLTNIQNKINPAISKLSSFNNVLEKTNKKIKEVNKNAKKNKSNNKSNKNDNEFLKELTGSFGKFKGSVGSVGKALLGLVGISTFSNFLSEGIELSNELTENMNLLNVSLKQNSQRALDFAENMQKVLGVDMSKVIRYQTTFYNLAEGFGLASEEAYIMSKNLTQLSYDMSSFLNIPIDQAMQKIKSGFSGEIEPMRAVGIALDQATLQETAYTLGINKRVNTMTRAQKTQLLYYQIMTKTQKMQGDMARTLIQPANAIRILKEQFNLLARAVGNMVIPILMKLIPYIMVLTKWATAAAQAIAEMLGFKIEMNDWDVSNISAGIEDIGDAADGTTKALKKMLAPFDELNVIDFGNDGSGTGVIGGGLFDIPTYDYDALTGALSQNLGEAEEKLKSIKDIILGLAGALAGWKLADWLGLKGKQKFGLTLTLTSLPFYIEGIAGIANGELTPEKFMKSFAGAAGLGVGAGMLTGNWKLGLIIGVSLVSWTTGTGIGEWIKQQFPDSIDWYIKQFDIDFDRDNVVVSIAKTIGAILGILGDVLRRGIHNLLGEEFGDKFLWTVVDSIPILSIIVNIADIAIHGTDAHILKPIKEFLILGIGRLLRIVADYVENIPVVGSAIANGIRAGVTNAEKNIEGIITTTTTTAMDNSKEYVAKKADFLANFTGNTYVESFKNKITISRDSMGNTIKEMITDASNMASTTSAIGGDNNATIMMSRMNNRIANSKTETTNTLTQMISDVSASVDTSSTTNIANRMTRDFSWTVRNSGLKQELSKYGEETGKAMGNSVSDNMKVNNSTFGRTLNSVISGTLSKIVNNNWNIFGSGGFLSNLLNFRWTFFESGGFPTEGQAFIARENGPELVGRIGNKSAVANNDQIIAGITQGVSVGVAQAMAGNNSKQPINVYVGNRQVYSGYGEYANTENNMYGVNVIKV